jgi:hypothetical protein
MIIEFNTVRTNDLEMFERGQEIQKSQEMGMEYVADFYNESDWEAITSLDMTTVIDWSEGTVWLNDTELPCVYARLHGGFMTSAILISIDDFRKIYEKIFNIEVKSGLDYLNGH